MNRRVRIGGACLNQIPLDWEGNIRNIVNAIEEARAKKINILCLPELCLTGYGCEDVFLSTWLPEKAFNKLSEIIPHTKDISVTIGLPVKHKDKTYNCIAIIENRLILGFYAKHNLANEGVHYEPRWFSSWPYHSVTSVDFEGKAIPFGSLSLDLQGIRTGFEICEDAWQEDRPACNLIEDGVELIMNPSASHFAFNKEEFRENLVVSSSEKFECAYLYTNLLGNEAGRMIYDGDVIIARNGTLIGHNKRFSFRDYNILSLELDFDSDFSENDVRDDPSGKLEEFSHAVPLALFDYCRKSHSNGFVLSLSGGADSSSIATLVAHMVRLGVKELGIKRFTSKLGLPGDFDAEKSIVDKILITAYQGTKNSSKATFESAGMLARDLGARFLNWNIDEEVLSYTEKIQQALNLELNWKDHDITLQNIQSRARSPVIWMLANLSGSLLLTTSNRSEGDVGYTTMDGDTSGSISPIAAVDKQFILEWLKYAESQLGYEGLKGVLSLQPTAELRPLEMAQTDEEDLMPYPVLASIERLAIRDRKSPVQVYSILKAQYDQGQLKKWIRKFYRLWSINQWKRERIAPSFHVDDFNVDPRTWCRFPILSSGFDEELRQLDDLSS